MKKVIKTIALGLVAVFAVSCSDAHKKDCEAINAGLKSGNFEEVITLSNALYDNLQDCSIETLSTLTKSYLILASAPGEALSAKEYLRKAIECYDVAKEKNPKKTEEVYQKLGKEMAPNIDIDFDKVMDVFRQQLENSTWGFVNETQPDTAIVVETELTEIIEVE